jgi:hypothetical protein
MANIFPKWSNSAPFKIGFVLTIVSIVVTIGWTYYFTPKYSRVGYEPIQPVPFQHSLHVTQLGMDCRYCHTYVDRSGHSNVPTSSTCMNCHSQVLTDSPALAPIRQSYESGEPVPWVRIHKTPDYVYFNHSVHVNRGISCVECHGQVNEMDIVHQVKPLSMLFCLDCHRDPESFVRPVEEVYNLNWKAPTAKDQKEMGTQFVHDWRIHPPQSCSGCHR